MTAQSLLSGKDGIDENKIVIGFIMILTQHFRERWIERVGTRPPTQAEIARMVRESVLVQPAMELYKRRQRKYIRHSVLAAYWHPWRGIILKMDENGAETVAVTVLSQANSRGLSRVNAYE